MNKPVAIWVLEALPVKLRSEEMRDMSLETGGKGDTQELPTPAQIRTVCPAVLWKAELNQQGTQIFS